MPDPCARVPVCRRLLLDLIEVLMMTTLQTLDSIRFLIDQKGKPAAVQMSIADWERLVEWIEEIEDRDVVKRLLPRLATGPAQALDWKESRAEWGDN